MRRIISKAFENFSLLALPLCFFLLSTISGAARIPDERVGPNVLSLQDAQNQTATKSEPQAPADPQVKAVLDKMAAAGIVHQTTVDDVRKAYLFYPKLSGTPERVFRIEDRQIPRPGGNITVRVYTSSPTGGLPVLVFFHGGGFVAGSLDTHDTPLRAVANRCGCIIVSVAYRLAPKDKFPAAPEDPYAATAWVAEHATDIGGDPHRIAVGGDGSGGNLAAVVTLMARERGTPHLTFQILIYPMLDATIMRPGWWTESEAQTVSRESKNEILGLYLPVAGNLRDPYVLPIFAENLKNLPPALVITDEDDPMRDEGEDYVGRLTQDGVPAKVSRYPNMIHGFFLMAGDLDAGKKCIDEAASALRNAFKGMPQTVPPRSN
ncbi:MAG TPA: alpha/beta hydrolase [Candidatus Acidoferrum sp.]|nr:alpha/beta hydrolase [Candidatus Acidoferrum sp.]